MTALALLSFLAAIVLLVVFIARWIKKQPKKWIGLSSLLCVTGFIFFAGMSVNQGYVPNAAAPTAAPNMEIVPLSADAGPVVKATPAATIAPTPRVSGVVVNVKEYANVRSEPHTDADIIGKASGGEKLIVLEESHSPGWHKIEYDGQVAYISADYFEVGASGETPSPTPRPQETEPPEEPEQTAKPTATPKPTAAPTETPKSANSSVTFEQIYKDYKDNEYRADDKYAGNRYRITATVSNIGGGVLDKLLNWDDDIFVAFEVRVGRTIALFKGQFPQSQLEAIKKISNGDKVTFEGECRSWGTWYDCKLVDY